MSYFNHTFWKMVLSFILILIVGILGIIGVGAFRGDLSAPVSILDSAR